MNIEEAFGEYKKGAIPFSQAVSVVVASDRSAEDKLHLIEVLLATPETYDTVCSECGYNIPHDHNPDGSCVEGKGVWKGRQPDGPHTIL